MQSHPTQKSPGRLESLQYIHLHACVIDRTVTESWPIATLEYCIPLLFYYVAR
jgi:hypothetical protein